MRMVMCVVVLVVVLATQRALVRVLLLALARAMRMMVSMAAMPVLLRTRMVAPVWCCRWRRWRRREWWRMCCGVWGCAGVGASSTHTLDAVAGCCGGRCDGCRCGRRCGC